jgi:hypothetical protein
MQQARRPRTVTFFDAKMATRKFATHVSGLKCTLERIDDFRLVGDIANLPWSTAGVQSRFKRRIRQPLDDIHDQRRRRQRTTSPPTVVKLLIPCGA